MLPRDVANLEVWRSRASDFSEVQVEYPGVEAR